MAYEKIVWSVGDEVTAEKLNHMERGIANATPGDKIFAPLQMVTIDGSTGGDGAEIEFDEEAMYDYAEEHGGDLSGLIVGLACESYPDGIQLQWTDYGSVAYFEFVDPETSDVYQVRYGTAYGENEPKLWLIVRGDRGGFIQGDYEVAVAAPAPQNLPFVTPADEGKSLAVNHEGKWVATNTVGGLYRVHVINEPGHGFAESFNDIKLATEAGMVVYYFDYVLHGEEEYWTGMYILTHLNYSTDYDCYIAEFRTVGDNNTYTFVSYDPDDSMFEPDGGGEDDGGSMDV